MSTQNSGLSGQDRHGRNPLLLLGGFALLGLALALLLFGGSLFGAGAEQTTDEGNGETGILQQVPEFSQPIQSGTNPIVTGGEPLQVGDAAYDFTVNDLTGSQVNLSDYRGQPVIINFWATWCAPCRVEMPELQTAFMKYRDEGLVILALDQDEPPDIVRAFFHDELGLTFTPLLDEKGAVAQQYGVFNFPSTFFIDPEGVITAVHRGPLVQSQIEGYLADTIPPG